MSNAEFALAPEPASSKPAPASPLAAQPQTMVPSSARLPAPALASKPAAASAYLADTRAMLQAGATRIGASASVKILAELSGQALASLSTTDY